MIGNGFRALLGRLPLIAALLVALGVSIPQARANVFEVKNIAVDVKAATAAEARQQALVEAERRAFYILLGRLTLTIDQERIPELSQQEISAYVSDFSVASEKASTVRYIARLDYRFRPDGIRDLLRSYRVPFAETRSKPMVILPVHEVGATAVLWDEPNPWRQAWRDLPGPGGLVPLILPIGDLSDISTIGAGEALAGDPIRLDAITQRYQAAGAIVAHSNLTVDQSTGRQQAIVTLLRPSDPIALEEKSAVYVQQTGEDIGVFMARLARATEQRIENLWKQRNLIYEEVTGVLAITVPITGLGDWLEVKRQLAKIGIIRHAEVVLISRDQVRVNVHYAGGPEQLTTALEQSNLSLLQEGGEWIVMPIGVLQPPRT